MFTATTPINGIAAEARRIPDQYKVICPSCLEPRLPLVLTMFPMVEEGIMNGSDLLEFFAPDHPSVPDGIFLGLDAEKLGVFLCTRCGDYCLATPDKHRQAQSLVEATVARIERSVPRLQPKPCCCDQH